ncbi:MAG: POTRA domain-containing protein [Thioalkalivibrio sp.]
MRSLFRGPRGQWTRIVCVALLMLASSVLLAQMGLAPRVGEIRFEGNKGTRDSVLRQELLLREGDPATPALIEATRQSIMNLGLFKDVEADVETRGDEAVVTYRVTEKFFYFALPRLNRNADGDIRYGGELRADNLFGLNQQLRLLYEKEDTADGGSEQGSSHLRLDYDVPRVPGTEFGAGLSLGERTTEQSPSDGEFMDRYEERSRHVGLSLSRWLDRRGPTRGWRMDLGLRWEARDYAALDPGVRVPNAGEDVSWTTGVIFTDVADFGVRREGVAYGGTVTFGATELGAGRNHQRVDVFYRRYLNLGGELPSSLNYQLRAGWVGDTPFGGEAYSIGSSSTLRGYGREYRTGDVRLLANVEYLRPLFGRPAVRGVVFTDMGGVWPKDSLELGDLRASAGLGLRINLRWFVRTDLRLDAAYGEEGKIYAGTSHVF